MMHFAGTHDAIGALNYVQRPPNIQLVFYLLLIAQVKLDS